MDFVRVGAVVGHLRAADDDLDRRRRAEAHDLVDDVGRLERQPQVVGTRGNARGAFPFGEPLVPDPRAQVAGQLLAEAAFQFLDADRAALERNPHDSLFRPARPEVDAVDGVAGRHDADVPQRDFDVLRPDLLADEVQGLPRDFLGLLDAGAVRGPQPELELTGVYLGEDLRTQESAQEERGKQGRGEINRHDHPAHGRRKP